MVPFIPPLAQQCRLNTITSHVVQKPHLLFGAKSRYSWPVLVYRRGGCAVFQALTSVTPNEMLSG